MSDTSVKSNSDDNVSNMQHVFSTTSKMSAMLCTLCACLTIGVLICGGLGGVIFAVAVSVVGVMCGVSGACTAGVTCNAGAVDVGGESAGRRVRCGAATVSCASCSRSRRAACCRSCRSSLVTDASEPPRSYALTRARVCLRCVDVTSEDATPPNILAALCALVAVLAASLRLLLLLLALLILAAVLLRFLHTLLLAVLWPLLLLLLLLVFLLLALRSSLLLVLLLLALVLLLLLLSPLLLLLLLLSSLLLLLRSPPSACPACARVCARVRACVCVRVSTVGRGVVGIGTSVHGALRSMCNRLSF